MNKTKCLTLAALLLASLAGLTAVAAEKHPLPKEDVVDVPAIGLGLCVANVFPSNMVLQRDKPLNIWGWAEPGEEVVVVFAGQEVRARAAADRAWQVTLQPIPANPVPQTMTVKGKSTTLTLENILVGDEQLPLDAKWKDFETLLEWPDWFKTDKPRPSGRYTFTSSRHYKKNSPLASSGLLGPVTIQVSKRTAP